MSDQTTDPTPAAQNASATRDYFELLVSELVKISAILVGIGITPFLHQRGFAYWAPGLVAGGLALGISLFFLFRRSNRQASKSQTATDAAAGGAASAEAPSKVARKGFRKFLAQTGRDLLDHGQVLVQHARQIRRRAARPGAASGQPGKDAPAPARLTTPAPWQTVVLLPLLALIGVFLLVPALAALVFYKSPVSNLDLILLYFSAPAILAWVIGELVYCFPKIIVRPKHTPEIAGILKSCLQVLSALLLWIFLGLAIGQVEFTWMLWLSIGLALAGLLCGLWSESSAQPRPDRFG